MPYPKVTTVYECSKCHKIYTNREDAVKCEESHKCFCEKQKFYRFGYTTHWGDAVISGVYFNEKKISLIIDNDGTTRECDFAKIEYCPFCGRKL